MLTHSSTATPPPATSPPPGARPLSTCLTVFLPLAVCLLLPHAVRHYYQLGGMAGSSGAGPSYRPRNSFARIMVDKLNAERELGEQLAEEKWYQVDLQLIQDLGVRDKFVQLNCDTDTHHFIQESKTKSDWIFTQIYHNVAKAFLSVFYSQTDINGILNRGSMFVLSRAQLQLLLRVGEQGEESGSHAFSSLLDLGAGDGRTTLPLAHSFSKVFATEASATMRKLLVGRGFNLLEIETWPSQGPFSMISCLNLLDRCDKPLSILRDAWAALEPEGYLLVALVLPFKPYVEWNDDHLPIEKLEISGVKPEHQVEKTVNIISNIGFNLISWSRVPYLCEGDLNRPLYRLDDYVMLFRRTSETVAAQPTRP